MQYITIKHIFKMSAKLRLGWGTCACTSTCGRIGGGVSDFDCVKTGAAESTIGNLRKQLEVRYEWKRQEAWCGLANGGLAGTCRGWAHDWLV